MQTQIPAAQAPFQMRTGSLCSSHSVKRGTVHNRAKCKPAAKYFEIQVLKSLAWFEVAHPTAARVKPT